MAYPYKKMTSQDCDYIRSVTALDRVWVGEEIASEYFGMRCRVRRCISRICTWKL